MNSSVMSLIWHATIMHILFTKISLACAHGKVSQMQVFILINCGGLLYVVTVLLEYLTDCCIKVFQSSLIAFF